MRVSIPGKLKAYVEEASNQFITNRTTSYLYQTPSFGTNTNLDSPDQMWWAIAHFEHYETKQYYLDRIKDVVMCGNLVQCMKSLIDHGAFGGRVDDVLQTAILSGRVKIIQLILEMMDMKNVCDRSLHSMESIHDSTPIRAINAMLPKLIVSPKEFATDFDQIEGVGSFLKYLVSMQICKPLLDDINDVKPYIGFKGLLYELGYQGDFPTDQSFYRIFLHER